MKNRQIFSKKILLCLITPILIYGGTLNFDADGDGSKDTLVYIIKDLHKYPNLNEPTISISITTKKKKYNFDTYYSAYPILSSCGVGCISIHQMRGGYSGLDLEEHYIFDKKREHWFSSETFRIDYVFQPKDTFKKFILKCKNKDKKLLDSITDEYLDYYLEHYQLTIKTLTTYNNIAYYLQKAGANEEAVYLLEKIIEKFPNRTVAYYNLGDAYWALERKEEAKKMYETYVKQMTAKGKEKRIPKVVKERIGK